MNIILKFRCRVVRQSSNAWPILMEIFNVRKFQWKRYTTIIIDGWPQPIHFCRWRAVRQSSQRRFAITSNYYYCLGSRVLPELVWLEVRPFGEKNTQKNYIKKYSSVWLETAFVVENLFYLTENCFSLLILLWFSCIERFVVVKTWSVLLLFHLISHRWGIFKVYIFASVNFLCLEC